MSLVRILSRADSIDSLEDLETPAVPYRWNLNVGDLLLSHVLVKVLLRLRCLELIQGRDLSFKKCTKLSMSFTRSATNHFFSASNPSSRDPDVPDVESRTSCVVEKP